VSRWRWQTTAIFAVGFAGGILATQYVFSARLAQLDHRADSLATVVATSQQAEALHAQADSAAILRADSLQGSLLASRARAGRLAREQSRVAGILVTTVSDTTALALLDSLTTLHGAERAEWRAALDSSEARAAVYRVRWLAARDTLIPALQGQRDALEALIKDYRAARVPRRSRRIGVGLHAGYGATAARGEVVTGPQAGLSLQWRVL